MERKSHNVQCQKNILSQDYTQSITNNVKVKFIRLKSTFFQNAFLGSDRFTIHRFLLSSFTKLTGKKLYSYSLHYVMWNYMKTIPLKALTKKKQYYNI